MKYSRNPKVTTDTKSQMIEWNAVKIWLSSSPNPFFFFALLLNPRFWISPPPRSAIAHQLSPYQNGVHTQFALLQAKVIGQHPQSFPDTHGSPIMGMGYTAVGANVVPDYFRQLMESNRWWFTLAQCHDGSFYYQPNRDNAGYGSDSRIAATAVTAFIFSIPKGNLHLTRKKISNRYLI